MYTTHLDRAWTSIHSTRNTTCGSTPPKGAAYSAATPHLATQTKRNHNQSGQPPLALVSSTSPPTAEHQQVGLSTTPAQQVEALCWQGADAAAPQGSPLTEALHACCIHPAPGRAKPCCELHIHQSSGTSCGSNTIWASVGRGGQVLSSSSKHNTFGNSDHTRHTLWEF
jgi:hypothetical protein